MMTKKGLIKKVKTKENAYLRSRKNENNYSKTTRAALREWYGEACTLFTAYIPKDDTDFKEFIDKDSVSLFEDIYDKKIVNYKKLMAYVEYGQIAKPLNNPEEQTKDGPAVFISHSSNDKDMIKSFIDNILKLGLGLTDSQIVCTSLEPYGVEGGNNIPEFICEKIRGAKVFLAMVSPNYKSSEVCMNELGAAWALEREVIQIVFSETNFDNLCWLINTDKAIRVDKETCLDSLIEKLYDSIEIKEPKQKLFTSWNIYKKEFLESLEEPKKLVQNKYSHLTDK